MVNVTGSTNVLFEAGKADIAKTFEWRNTLETLPPFCRDVFLKWDRIIDGDDGIDTIDLKSC